MWSVFIQPLDSEAPIETEPEPKKQKREPRSKLPDAQPEKEKKTESSSPSRTLGEVKWSFFIKHTRECVEEES